MKLQQYLAPAFEQLAVSPTLFINETVNELWRQGKPVFHMGFGESRFAVHPKIQQALSQNTHYKSYLPAKGLPALCDTVASYYSDKLEIDFKSSQVIIGPGSKALIFSIMMALDADILLPTPSWVSYEPQATLLGRKTVAIPATTDDDYQLNMDAIKQSINNSENKNKLLILNSPNNPTGQILDKQFLQELAVFCRENNIIVLSDEIYFRVTHGKQTHHSIAYYYPEGTLILGGLSKHLSMGGWRVGVALLPNNPLGAELMSALITIASEIWSAVASPIQHAAITAYGNDQDIENYIESCSTLHGIRSEFIYKGLSDLGIRCTKPQGAFYLTVNFDCWRSSLNAIGITTSTQLAEYLLANHSIAALPGAAFGIDEQALSLRLSTSYLDMETDQDSQRLLDILTSDDNEDIMSMQHHPNIHKAIIAFKNFVEPLQTS